MNSSPKDETIDPNLSIHLVDHCPSELTVRQQVLRTAEQYVMKNRNTTYGEPEDNFSTIASMANVIFAKKLKEDFTSADVAVFQIIVKLSRLKDNTSHLDSWIDTAGYAACGAECAEKMNNG